MELIIGQKKINNIIQSLILLADVGLIIKIGIIKPYTLQPFEFFTLLAFGLILFSSFFFTMDASFILLLKKYGKVFLLMVAFLLIGTIMGILEYGKGNTSTLALIKDFILLIIVFLGTIAHIYFGRDAFFRKKVLWTMCPIVVFSLFLLIPEVALRLGLMGNNDSLIALQGNQNVLANFLLIPTIFFTNLIFTVNKYWKKWAAFISAILSFSLLLWTGSRGGWIAFGMSLCLIFFLQTIQVKPLFSRIKKLLLFMVIGLFGMSVAFFILPHNAKVMVLDRVFPNIISSASDPLRLEDIKLRDAVKIAMINPPSILAHQNRQNMWPRAFMLSVRHPLGLGPEYATTTNAIIESDGRPAAAHNSFLQAALSGGWLLLVIFICIILYVCKFLYFEEKTQENILLASLWLALLVGICFNDYLFYLPWVWIVAGIIIGKKEANSVTPSNR